MSVHVDIVQLDWGKGTQTLMATVFTNRLDVIVQGDDWLKDVVLRPYLDRETGRELTPTAEPERFVERLHTVMNGSHMPASELHDDDVCPFLDGIVLEGRKTLSMLDRVSVLRLPGDISVPEANGDG
jgi:hypothetical protein